MDHPLLFLLSPAAERVTIEPDLLARYGGDYQVLSADSAEAALLLLAARRAGGQPVALLLVSQDLPGLSGTDFLAQAAPDCPGARIVLLAAAKDTEAAITGINQLGIHQTLETHGEILHSFGSTNTNGIRKLGFLIFENQLLDRSVEGHDLNGRNPADPRLDRRQ